MKLGMVRMLGESVLIWMVGVMIGLWVGVEEEGGEGGRMGWRGCGGVEIMSIVKRDD